MNRTMVVLFTAAFTAAAVPAADYTWLPATGTNNWNVGGNWSGGVIPTATDNAIIDVAGTYTVLFTDDRGIDNYTLNRSTATVNHTGGTLTVGGAFNFSAGTYNLSGGALTFNGSMTAAAGTNFNWSGGTISGAGTTTLNGTGTVSVATTKVLNGVLTVGSGGSLTVTAGSVRTDAVGSGVSVQAGGVLDLRADGTLLTNSQPGTLANAGTLRRHRHRLRPVDDQ